MEKKNNKPMSFEEFVSVIREMSRTGMILYPAFEGYIGHLPENIKFQPGDIVMFDDRSPIIHDYPGLQGVGIVVEVPRDLAECYTEYRDRFISHLKAGLRAESLYEDPYGCNCDERADYCVQIGPITEDMDAPYSFTTADYLRNAADEVGEEDKAVLLEWYAQFNKKVEEVRKEEERIISMMTDYVGSSPNFKLFREHTGKWGTRDSNGDIHDNAIYIAVERDGEVVFTDGHGCVCNFDPDEGMTVAAWCQPWWENTLLLADFPEELNKYWFNRRAERLDMFDEISIYEVSKLDGLTDLQRRILDDLDFTCRYEQEIDEDAEKLEQEWFAAHPNDLSNNERVIAIAELTRRPDLTEILKSSLWYANFMFIEYFGETKK